MQNVLRPHTLASIAAAQGVNKRAAQEWLRQAKQAEGGEVGEIIGKTRYFNDEERDILLRYAGEPRNRVSQAKVPDLCEEAVSVPVSVEVGNHSTPLILPDLGQQSYSLENFRDNSVTCIDIDDPMTVVDQFIDHADRLIEGMNADIARRQQKLRQSKKAHEKVAEKVDDLKAQAQHYRRKSREIAYQQSEQATELKESMELLQDLGKPQAAAQGTTAS